MAKVRIKHNMTDDEYIDTLEKAVKKANAHSEGPHADLEDKHAQKIRDNSYKAYATIMDNMEKEIKLVVNRR